MRIEADQELSQLLGVPMVAFSEFVTEDEDGDYVQQATSSDFMSIYGPWDPEGR